MNKNVMLVLGAVVIVGLGLFMVMGSGSEEVANKKNVKNLEEETANDTKDEVKDGVTVVNYNDDGFEPEDVTVAVGDTVKFTNSSSSSMWVASDDHPTHTELSEFDNKQGVGPGETYEFTFSKAGTWGYHDHLNSGEGGKITVTE